MTQRQPRVEHPAYLAWVRKQPCTVSRRPPPSDAAHLRSASLAHNKPLTGMQRKPSDWWTLPLNHELHMAQHDRGDELAWWAEQGIPDPFALAMALYESRPPMAPAITHKRPAKRKAKKPSRPISQRPDPWPDQSRPIQTRNNLRKAMT